MAVRNGHNEGPGIGYRWSGSASSKYVTSTSRLSEARPTSGGGVSSGCHNGSRPATVGCGEKLYGGGGDEVAHSSPAASQGLSPAMAPPRTLTITLIK